MFPCPGETASCSSGSTGNCTCYIRLCHIFPPPPWEMERCLQNMHCIWQGAIWKAPEGKGIFVFLPWGKPPLPQQVSSGLCQLFCSCGIEGSILEVPDASPRLRCANHAPAERGWCKSSPEWGREELSRWLGGLGGGLNSRHRAKEPVGKAPERSKASHCAGALPQVQGPPKGWPNVMILVTLD